jgi:hypothetical protein
MIRLFTIARLGNKIANSISLIVPQTNSRLKTQPLANRSWPGTGSSPTTGREWTSSKKHRYCCDRTNNAKRTRLEIIYLIIINIFKAYKRLLERWRQAFCNLDWGMLYFQFFLKKMKIFIYLYNNNPL